MPEDTTNSFQYYPIIINDNYPLKRDEIYNKFKEINIYTRKYFYPACCDYECYKNDKSSIRTNLNVVNDIKNKVLCLPFYGNLSTNVINLICSKFNNFFKE